MAFTIKNVKSASAADTSVTLASLGSASAGDLAVVLVGGAAPSSSSLPTDDASNTYIYVKARNDGVSGAGFYYCFLSTGSAGLTITAPAGAGGEPLSAVAWLCSGLNSYNSDEADAANFSGSSTAWAVGSTSPAPAANSVFFYVGSAILDQTGLADATGYNSLANGFDSTMNSAAKIFGAGIQDIWTGYKVSSSAESVSATMSNAANWFGVLASFAPTSSGTTQHGRRSSGEMGARAGSRQILF